MAREVEGRPEEAQVGPAGSPPGRPGESRAAGARRSRALVPLLLLAAALGAPASADRVKLANGRTLDGAVRDLGDAIELTMAFGGKVVLSKSSILAIEKDGNLRGEYLSRAAATSASDPDAQYALAMWCRDRGLRKEMKEHLDRALVLDPRHARALAAQGYADLGTKWPDLPAGWQTVTSAHFAISSALAVADARSLAEDLEIFFAEFSNSYGAHYELRPVTEPVRVLLYLDPEQFAEVALREFKTDVRISEKARAHLDGFADAKNNRLVAKINPLAGTRNRETLFHEGTHLLVALQLEEGKRISGRDEAELERARQRELARLKSGRGILWFHEGLASYYGGSSVTEGRFVPGLYQVGGQASVALVRLKQAIRDRETLSLDAVVDGGVAEFLGERYDLYYAQSWMLVHFLHQAGGGKYRERWYRLTGEHRQQDGGVAAFRRAFGAPPSDFTEEWQDYVLAMREGQ